MLKPEERKQFNDLLEEIGQSLDITEEQYNAAVKSYQAVGEHLSKDGSLLKPYAPEILPQGSFMLGTMIRPINEGDDLDIDLVCQLTGKRDDWTQYNLKKAVGDQLKSSKVYEPMLEEEGRRCWTLAYSNASNYHMDILPAIVEYGYKIMLEKAFSESHFEDVENIAIRITDKDRSDYFFETNHLEWLKSNPFGFGKWFFYRASLENRKTILLSESIHPVPKYQKDKLPLQRVVQILKRHRDQMFKGDEHKPISIIITTLAAKAYNKEMDVLQALQNVLDQMPYYIERREDPLTGRIVKWIANPVNPLENFADKWNETPQKEENFYKWIRAIKEDIDRAINQKDRGLNEVMETLKEPFGKKTVLNAFSNYGEKQLRLRESSSLKMAGLTGMIGLSGRTTISQHTNYGAENEE